MRCGHDGNGLFGDINAQLQTTCKDIGKVLLDKGQRLVRNVEVDAVQAAFFHFKINSTRHNIARCQLGAWVVRGHEPRTVWQQQPPALAAHGFAD